jgi:hypothetical protein
VTVAVSNTVVVQQPSRAAHSLGIGSVVLGVVGLMLSFMPCVGWIGLPLSALGLLLGVAGGAVAVSRGGHGIGFPITGFAVSGLALAIGAFWLFLLTSVPKAMHDSLAPFDRGGRQAVDRPKQPREWYRAEWSSFGRSRELDFNFGNGRRNLKIQVFIRTEPDLPIKELYGHLAILKEDKILHEREIAEKPDISFSDVCVVIFTIPYDDNSPTDRTLRYAKDSELMLVLTIRKIVLADGKVRTFD